MKKSIILLTILDIIITMCITFLFLIDYSEADPIAKTTFSNAVFNDNSDKNRWKKYKKINDDYVGQIVFDSELINKPFVQAKSCYKSNNQPYKFFNQDGSIVSNFVNYNGNDVYNWMDFETMKYDYDENGGSIYMDYRNNLDDQNIIIYGHCFSPVLNKDPERIKALTPLEALLEQDKYYNNNIVKLYLQNEIRTYELWAVYRYNSEFREYYGDCQYYRPNYNVDDNTGLEDMNYYKKYIEFVNRIKLYDTDVDLTTNDRTLTFQISTIPDNYLYEICVFKQISTEKY